ncbi:IS630 family transposase (plasmid) [Microvirga sp. RSM25]|uniref:IS630 family transposase n=1 Tax=Microvirga sp. RSM25 TaxID=3273802 RepID=UPI00384EAFDB
MKHVDMRKLPAAAQEERRRQVIGLRQCGLTDRAIAAQVGLSPTGVFDICRRFATEGAPGLVSKPRGRKPDEQRLLDAAQEAEIRRLICRHTPDELDLPFALWSRMAVRAVIWQRCGIALAVRSVGKDLARWDFTAQKPLRRAYEQNPAAVRHWLRREYPAIVAAARQARGTIFWGDETGLRADDVRGLGSAPRGRTPVIRVCHRRAGLSLIVAVSNRGALRWMIVDAAVTAASLIRFLHRLIRDAKRKGLLILDRLRVHWAKIEVFYLPAYSPELNPVEGLNADLKQVVTRQSPARSKQQLKRATVRHMRRLSNTPARVRSYFSHKAVRYAA